VSFLWGWVGLNDHHHAIIISINQEVVVLSLFQVTWIESDANGTSLVIKWNLMQYFLENSICLNIKGVIKLSGDNDEYPLYILNLRVCESLTQGEKVWRKLLKQMEEICSKFQRFQLSSTYYVHIFKGYYMQYSGDRICPLASCIVLIFWLFTVHLKFTMLGHPLFLPRNDKRTWRSKCDPYTECIGLYWPWMLVWIAQWIEHWMQGSQRTRAKIPWFGPVNGWKWNSKRQNFVQTFVRYHAISIHIKFWVGGSLSITWNRKWYGKIIHF
jgi:hypothetical protein